MTAIEEPDTKVLEPTTPGASPASGAPALAPGTELMGAMEDSGFEQTPYLVRRADGQVIQLPGLLYALAERIDGQSGYDQIAPSVSEAVGAGIDPDDACFLVDEKLAPLGLIAGPDAAAAAQQREAERADQPKPGDDLLALTWKAKVISERASHRITSLFRPLFFGPVMAVLVLSFVALCGWLFFSHGISQPVRAILYNPALLVMVFAAVVVATAFHEIGHATACRYGGAKPGVMGVGLYVIWPVLYTDVTSSYGLSRRGRLRTDLGGVYFNAIFALGCAAVYAATRWEPILVLVMVQTFAILQQLLPLGRLDGYLILTDLTGVPDLLGRMKPILRSALPWRRPESEVADLKPWVRRVATGYIVLLIPVLVLILVMMALHAPRVFATAYDSLGLRWHKVTHAGDLATGAGDGFQCLALVLPALGMVVSSIRVGKRVGGGALAWSAGSAVRRAVVLTGTTAVVGVVAYTWWPNGDYRPIQPGERGTIQGGIQDLSAVPSGRPSLTPQRQQQLHGAPFESRRPNARSSQTGNSAHTGQGGKPSGSDQTTTGTNGTTTGTTQTTSPGTTTTPATTDTTPTTTDTTPTTTDTSTTTTPGDTGTSTTPTDTGTQTTPTDTTTSTTPTTTDTTPTTTTTTTQTTTTP